MKCRRSYNLFPDYFSSNISLFLLINCLGLINGFTVGVPPLRSVCISMNPQHHDYPSQGTESPYEVTVSKNQVNGGDNVEFVLKAIEPEKKTKFIGFYVQARNENDTPIGTFTPNKDTKVHSCGGIRANAAHHASGNVKKENVTIIWTAPREFQGDVVFTATALQNFVTYWVYHQSDPVTIIKNEMLTIASIVPSRPTDNFSSGSIRRPTNTNRFVNFNLFRNSDTNNNNNNNNLNNNQRIGGMVRNIFQNIQSTANRFGQLFIPPIFQIRSNNNNNFSNNNNTTSN